MDSQTDENGDEKRTGRYHHGDLKAALIAATLELIKEKRVEDLSVADAARAANVSSGAPYRHFKDRDELLAHVAAAGFRELNRREHIAFAKHPPGSIEGLIEGGCSYMEFGADNPELFHLMWGAARTLDQYDLARQSSEASYFSFIDMLTETMKSEGLGHLDPHVFGAPLWAMVHGFASLLIGKPKMFDSNRSAIRDNIANATRAYFSGYNDHFDKS
ncbi:MAG: TetR/AcrR family transcriptional regulator [Pseudomonadota bacterium]